MTDHAWQLSRRKFVESLVLTGVAMQLPWLQSCESKAEIPANIEPFNQQQFLDLRALLSVLFPDDGNGPGAQELMVDRYVLWVLKDDQADLEETDFLIKHTKLFSEEVQKREGDSFATMSNGQQTKLLKNLLKETDWCTRWSSRLLTLIFEALLLDPQYGVNPNEVGWKWLEHNPGYPRPAKEHLYPSILKKKNEV